MNLISKTIGQFFDERVELTPSALFMRDDTTRLSWKDAGIRAERQAVSYLKAGMAKGEHAAILGLNCTEWIITYLALAKIGVVGVLVNAALKENELLQLVKDNSINYIIYGNGRDGSLKTVAQRLQDANITCLKQVFSMFDEVSRSEPVSGEEAAELKRIADSQSSDDIVNILFTSGTSGQAKGAMLTHYNLINNARGIAERMHWGEDAVMCTATPLFHCFGVTVGILGAVSSGAALVLLPYFSSTAVLKAIETYRCTVFNGVPTFFLALVNNKQLSQYDISSLKSGLMAGSPIVPSEYRKMYQALQIDHLQTAFGQTESSPAVTVSQWDDEVKTKANTSGTAMEHVEVRIWDNNKKQAVVPGQEGEILTRGYLVMKGYYHMPEESRTVIDADGWLHTGDFGYMDMDGYLHVTGRIKDIILRGGENISPAEIENILTLLPEVQAVKVIGIKANILQEQVAACVIWKDGKTLSLTEVQTFARNYLADFKIPEVLYTFQTFPTNASGKIMTDKLKELIDETSKKGANQHELCK